MAKLTRIVTHSAKTEQAAHEVRMLHEETRANANLYADFMSKEQKKLVAAFEKQLDKRLTAKQWSQKDSDQLQAMQEQLVEIFEKIKTENADKTISVVKMIETYLEMRARKDLSSLQRKHIEDDLDKLLRQLGLENIDRDDYDRSAADRSREAHNRSIQLKRATELADKITATAEETQGLKDHLYELKVGYDEAIKSDGFKNLKRDAVDRLLKGTGLGELADMFDLGGKAKSGWGKLKSGLGKGWDKLKDSFDEKSQEQLQQQKEIADEQELKETERHEHLISTTVSESNRTQQLLSESIQIQRNMLNEQERTTSLIEQEQNKQDLVPLKKSKDKSEDDEESEGGGIIEKLFDVIGGKKGKLAKTIFKGGKGLLRLGGKGLGMIATSLFPKAAPIAGRIASRFLPVTGKIGGGLLSKAGGLAAGMAGRLGVNALKAVPGLGLAATAAMAAYDGYKGWDSEKAKALYGDDSFKSKAKSSLAHIGSGLTFGLADPKQVSDFFGKMMDYSPWSLLQKGISKVFDFKDSDTFKALKDGFKEKLGVVKDFLFSPIETIGKGFNKLMDTLGSIPIVGDFFEGLRSPKMKQLATSVWKMSPIGRVFDTLTKIMKKIASYFNIDLPSGQQLKDGMSNAFQTAISSVGEAFGVDKGLGSVSAKYEGKVESANKDNKGWAYGKYQFNSATGGLDDFFKHNPKYAAQFKGLTPGTEEFNNKWREIAANDREGFEAAQHNTVVKTRYNPAAEYAGKLGYKLDNRGVQEMIFSGSVQHGGINKLLKQVASTPGFANMTPEQQIQVFYAARKQYVAGNVDAKTNAGLQSRYDSEVQTALQYARGEQSTNIAGAAANSVSTAASGLAMKVSGIIRNNATVNTKHGGTKAATKSIGRCARHVFNSLAAAGFEVGNADINKASGIQSAKDAVPPLKRAGFEVVGYPSADNSNAGAMPGDVEVWSGVPGHPDGHIAFFDGRNWISDFVQKGRIVASEYAGRARVTRLRHPKMASSGKASSGGGVSAPPMLKAPAKAPSNSGSPNLIQSMNKPSAPVGIAANPPQKPATVNTILSAFAAKPDDNIKSTLNLVNVL